MKKSILIVDDSKIVLDVNSFTFTSAGYIAYTAINGNEALEILHKNEIDIIITDINMPGMDGYSLIKKIRANGKLAETPIIIITTEQEAGDKKKGFDVGANVYIVKPMNTDEILSQVKILIG